MTRTLLLMTLLAGCTRAAPILSEELSLAEPAVVVAGHPGPASSVSMTATGWLAPGPTSMTLPISALDLRLRTGNRPRIETLEFPLPDMEVPLTSAAPNRLKLVDLYLGIDGPLAVQVVHAQDDALELHAVTPLTLRWAMVLDDGTVWPLGPTRTRDLDLDIQVVREGGATTTTVTARCPGSCWEIDGVADLSNAGLYLEADAVVTAP